MTLDPRLREEPYALEAHLGFALTHWAPDTARVEMPIQDRLANRQGLLHGGVHATLLDTAMGYAGCYTGDPSRKQMALTLSLNVNYLSRPSGTRLLATARRTGGGRATYFAEGEVRDETGALLATATGVFRLRAG